MNTTAFIQNKHAQTTHIRDSRKRNLVSMPGSQPNDETHDQNCQTLLANLHVPKCKRTRLSLIPLQQNKFAYKRGRLQSTQTAQLKHTQSHRIAYQIEQKLP